ncbi:hypothetical protein ACI2KR_06465 [Pseudomonas luteola]
MKSEEVDKLLAERDALKDRLRGLVNAVRTVNRGHAYKVMINGVDGQCFWQREGWVEYVLDLCNEAEPLIQNNEPTTTALTEKD